MASADSFGENGRSLQPVVWNGASTSWTVPSTAVSVPWIASGSHVEGLKMNPGRSTSTFTSRRRSGMPCRICGSGSASIVRCESVGSTWIAARTTTVPRSNGPASARIAIDRPNGAPL